MGGSPTEGWDRGRSRDDGDGCGQSVGYIGEPASLSKVVHPPRVGDRTSVAGRRFTVAGLCRNRTGFATSRGVPNGTAEGYHRISHG